MIGMNVSKEETSLELGMGPLSGQANESGIFMLTKDLLVIHCNGYKLFQPMWVIKICGGRKQGRTKW